MTNFTTGFMTHNYTPFTPPCNPPDTLTELQRRTQLIAGHTLGDLAQAAQIEVPKDFKRQKGWTGQLIELWLGATAGSKPEQDFAHLGIELKTLPISTSGKVLETTYVCYAHLKGVQGMQWQSSNVRNKLSKVLWLPIIGERHIPPVERQVATGFLWQPDETQDQQLREDWEEHMDAITMGRLESLTASQGTWLQIRPKAADGSVVTEVLNEAGETIQTRPRGFYLRKQFTQAILNNEFGL